MPTVLDTLGLGGLRGTEDMDGKSFLPVLKGEKQPEREYAFTEYHRTFGNQPYPMRAVLGKRYGYIVNFWAGRTGPMRMESMSGLSWAAMRKAAETDPELAARVELFQHRTLEEFFDFGKDPDALNNLIDSAEHQEEIVKMRAALEKRMKATEDPALEAFQSRDEPARIDAFIQEQKARGRR
jgi:N-sulfoglucosamine sulfohydrolase